MVTTSLARSSSTGSGYVRVLLGSGAVMHVPERDVLRWIPRQDWFEVDCSTISQREAGGRADPPGPPSAAQRLLIGATETTKAGPAAEDETPTKVTLTVRAVVRRINRRIAKGGRTGDCPRGERLRALRIGSVQGLPSFEYNIIDDALNAVVAHDVDPEEVARELGLIHPWERVVARRAWGRDGGPPLVEAHP